jgi:hypothetical protein
MNRLKRAMLVLAGLVGGLIAVIWIGLQVKPASLPAYPEQSPDLNERFDLPDGLPAPVARYYTAIAHGRLPVVTAAVMSGRGKLRLNGITFPARMRFTHDAGHGYRHYIELTLFGFPIFKVNEHFLNGRARMELPVGVIENEPKVDSAANLALWAEAMLFPTIFLTDDRVRWEAVDDTTAVLVVPGIGEEERITVTFDPGTGLLRTMEAPRYKGTADVKVAWRGEAAQWQPVHGVLTPMEMAVTWLDEGTPWLVATIDELILNVDVTHYIRASGP